MNEDGVPTITNERSPLELHDIANGEHFAGMHSDRVLYNHSTERWMIWDSGRWTNDDQKRIHEYAKQTSRRLQDMAIDIGSRELQKQAHSALGMNGVRNMLLSAQSLDSMAVKSSQLDTNPLQFNMRNGTLDLATGQLHEHRPGDRITMVAGCDFEPEAEAPEFQQCLKAYWPNPGGEDHGISEFLVRCMGYSLSGLNDEKLFLLLHGTGDTGKTTLMKAFEATWGDYYRTADWSTFAQQCDNDSTKHRSDLVRLVGARIVSASEGDERCKMSEGVLKRITGRSTISVREIYGTQFEVLPTFKIWLDTNHFPHFNAYDQAMWNRIVQLHFRHVISADAQRAYRKRVGNLDRVLANEASGILNIALRGWRGYMEAGSLIVPKSVRLSTELYRKKGDPLEKFFEDCCTPHDGYSEEKRKLFRAYSDWAIKNGESIVTPKQFGIWMIHRGYQETRTSDCRKWVGVALNGSFPREPDLGL